MHSDEFEIDAILIHGLISDQFPQWADLPIADIRSQGTVNAIFRLGDDLQIRLPRSPRWDPALDRQFEWLPRLAPLLPLQIPKPVARGVPTGDYPMEWSIFDWIEGDMPDPESIDDLLDAADALAEFIRALHGVDPTDAPVNTRRGLPLQTADPSTREAIEQLEGRVDTVAITRAWERALATPAWLAPPVWIHGDLWTSNVLVREGRVSAVIDFELVGLGDPAVDLLIAWSLFDEEARRRFRARTGVDDDTWERSKGWAISMSVLALPYYDATNRMIVAASERMLREVLNDAGV